MKRKSSKIIPIIISLVLCLVFGTVLLIYARPMEDVSLDLSLIDHSSEIATETTDEKGWEVYTCEGGTVTPLEHDGRGFYSGIELGQTFYFSRVMAEALDNPTLQIGTSENTFTVWLDDEVIYTDHPGMDNRIGYLQLPMNDYFRSEPIIITLPANYQGKTLTIAQSTPPYAEVSSLKAAPTSVRLYCGYAYESGIISETYSLAIAAAALFAAGLMLLVFSVLHRDLSIICIALSALFGMCIILANASFHQKYLGAGFSYLWYCRWFSALTLSVFLTLKAGRFKKVLWVIIALCAALTPVSLALSLLYPYTIVFLHNLLRFNIPEILFILISILSLVFGMVFWRRENRFYRLYAPLTLAAMIAYWTVHCIVDPTTFKTFAVGIPTLSFYQLYCGCLIVTMATALVSAIYVSIRSELERRTEQRLVHQQQELALAGYENLRRQHEEVMMLRHDMVRHFRTLRDMEDGQRRSEYLNTLIGRNENIRPVVESGNEMLDIILNGRLSAAADSGIKIDIQKAEAPAKLPFADADLCSLVMNIVDNAISAASAAECPHIRLNIHEQDGYLAISCENSTAVVSGPGAKKETAPKHGLGLKIIRSIAERYDGVFIAESGNGSFKVKLVLPLS